VTHTLLSKDPLMETFNFDLGRMKRAVAAPMHTVPVGLSTEALIAWMKRRKKQS